MFGKGEGMINKRQFVCAFAAVRFGLKMAHLCRLARCTKVVSYLRYCGRAGRTAAIAFLTHQRVRLESWQRIGGESPPRGRSSQPPRPRVMHEVLLARAAVKRSQGRPRAEY